MRRKAVKPDWIFFDIGGTLLEIYRPMAEVMHDYLGRAGHVVPVDPIKSAVRRVVPHLPTAHPSYIDPTENRRWWMTLYEQALREATLDHNVPEPSLLTVRDRIWEQHHRGDNLRVYADAHGLVDSLHDQGFRLGVISNWDDSLGPILARYGLSSAFDVVVTSTDLKTEKPDPRIFEHALNQAGIDPHRAAHVGDDWKCDVMGAAQVGMQPVWIERGVRSVVVQSAQPDEVKLPVEPIRLKSLQELPSVWKD
ncbi:MAG: HAD-IA family hydrolase [Blastocatellia bacterium]|nr:HAD-IA family hydrolase [Blastocatellia bacterium]